MQRNNQSMKTLPSFNEFINEATKSSGPWSKVKADIAKEVNPKTQKAFDSSYEAIVKEIIKLGYSSEEAVSYIYDVVYEDLKNKGQRF